MRGPPEPETRRGAVRSGTPEVASSVKQKDFTEATPQNQPRWEPFRDVSLGGWWLAFQKTVPWSPPPSLALALAKIHDDRIWLSEAVDAMAFGTQAPHTPIETAARRAQASRHLCANAARKGLVQMVGRAGRPGDASDPIPASYFDVPRQLGSDDNSLDVFSDAIPDDEFFPIDTGDGFQRWFSVRIETSSLIAWLTGVDAAPSHPALQEATFSGRGRTARLIETAFNKLYPNGLPAGVSSAARDEAIQREIESLHGKPVPTPRTIQKTLKKMRSRTFAKIRERPHDPTSPTK